MDRTRDREEERAAPIVPLDSAKAALSVKVRMCLECIFHCDGPELLRPKFGPEIW
jgi:hypothetical protein